MARSRIHGGVAKFFAGALICFCLFLIFSGSLHAARISDVMETSATEQATRFFSLKDRAVQLALIGSVLLGICSGLLGSFMVVRKMSLVGDALSHAVLPGVAIGFLWQMSKNPVTILIGATAAGVMGTLTIGWLTRTTKLKEDAALGLVLASFFAVGLCLMSMIQRLPTGAKSGLDKFLFGQAAALGSGDVQLIAVVTGVVILFLALFYKELLVISFDSGFARTTGFPVRIIHEVFMLLLAVAVVIGLQAVGAVLMSAMLITPAAAAYLLTDRMHRMLWIAAIIGMFAGVVGAFVSFLGNNLPTGPLMVLAASTIFGAAFIFSPRHGVVPRWWRRRSRTMRIGRENTLKAVFQILEAGEFKREGVTLAELSGRRRLTLEEARREVRALTANDLGTFDESREVFDLSTEGSRVARAVVRNHRLWELYLTTKADYRADHVHDDAEKMEHLLDEETVRELERRLDFPETDPHGKIIPVVRMPNAKSTGEKS